jgi:alkylated DNA repair protein alkB family protein 8
MESFEIKNCLNLKFEGSGNPDRTVVFYYTPFQCQELKKAENIEVPEAHTAKTGSIPGLYVYDNIISEEEEADLLKEIDSNEWTKLLNRRVQHYGYEFKYGTNDVDTDQ